MTETFAVLIGMFTAWPWLWLGTIFALGLLIGSFLNVVIHRVPIMLDREWRASAEEYLREVPKPLASADTQGASQSPADAATTTAAEAVASVDTQPASQSSAEAVTNTASEAVASAAIHSGEDELALLETSTPPQPKVVASNLSPSAPLAEPKPPGPRYDLIAPRSCCPKCGAPITALQNIPVVSYLVLGGKCANCRAPISIRYPIVELTTGILSAAVAWKFGVHWYTLAALYFTWTLLALSWIDFDTTLLPDNMTLPLVWGGILVALVGTDPTSEFPVDIRSSVIGAAAGYLSLRLVYHAHKRLTGKEGMAFGDFKLLGAIGAWLGWQSLPAVILLSSLTGSIVGGILILRGRNKETPIPFGPYLAVAGWVVLMWSDELMEFYWRASRAFMG